MVSQKGRRLLLQLIKVIHEGLSYTAINGIKNLNINMGLDPGPNSPERLDRDPFLDVR